MQDKESEGFGSQSHLCDLLDASVSSSVKQPPWGPSSLQHNDSTRPMPVLASVQEIRGSPSLPGALPLSTDVSWATGITSVSGWPAWLLGESCSCFTPGKGTANRGVWIGGSPQGSRALASNCSYSQAETAVGRMLGTLEGRPVWRWEHARTEDMTCKPQLPLTLLWNTNPFPGVPHLHIACQGNSLYQGLVNFSLWSEGNEGELTHRGQPQSSAQGPWRRQACVCSKPECGCSARGVDIQGSHPVRLMAS